MTFVCAHTTVACGMWSVSLLIHNDTTERLSRMRLDQMFYKSNRVIASVTDKWMWDSRCYDLQPVMDDGLSTLLVDLSNSRVDTKVRRNSVIRHAIHKNESCRVTLFVPKNFLVYILLSPYNNMSSGVLLVSKTNRLDYTCFTVRTCSTLFIFDRVFACVDSQLRCLVN